MSPLRNGPRGKPCNLRPKTLPTHPKRSSAFTPSFVFAIKRNYDLKAVNPNARSDEDTRTPENLLDLIEAKGRQVGEALSLLRRNLS